MDAIASLKEGLQVAHWVVEGTIDGLTSEQLHKLPGVARIRSAPSMLIW